MKFFEWIVLALGMLLCASGQWVFIQDPEAFLKRLEAISIDYQKQK